MKKQRIKKYLKQHPEILKAGDEKSSRSFIADEEIPDMQWFLEKNPELLIREKIIQKKKNVWYRSKRFLIPIATILVLGVFFVTTSIGSAFANNIYETVIEWLAGGININSHPGKVPPEAEKANESESQSYQSYDEVRSEYKIMTALNKDMAVNKINVRSTDPSLVITSIYIIPNGNTITLIQTIIKGPTDWFSTIDLNKGQPIKQKLPDNTDITGYFDDGSAYAVGYRENMSIEISSQSTTYDEFTRFLQGIRIE